MKILAIDSGIEKTGIAIFENKKLIFSTLIKTKASLSIEYRLKKIYDELKKIISKFRPQIIVIEKLFFFKNQKTAISVSHAQGIILLLASQNNIKVEFLTPLQIKQSLTGFGRADKKSIQKMLKLEFGINIKQDDVADAVACGLAYEFLISSNS